MNDLTRLAARPGMARPAALALVVLLLGAAAPVAYAALDSAAPAPAAVGNAASAPYVETGLLFGTARPDGGPVVTDQEFRAFVDKVVTPRFPEGLTVDTVAGQYRDRHGVIERERSYELSLLYPTSEASAKGAAIEEIRTAYTRRFAQESVARVDERVRVDF